VLLLHDAGVEGGGSRRKRGYAVWEVSGEAGKLKEEGCACV
jgi:hypothetical protein